MVELRKVNIGNWKECCKLSVLDKDKRFVRSSEGIIAKAYALGELADLYAIYYDEEAAGLVLIRYYEEGQEYVLDQMMIDKRFQQKGIGTKAFKELTSKLNHKRRYDSIILCYIEGNESAKKFYLKQGFEHTGEIDEDEVIMKLDLR